MASLQLLGVSKSYGPVQAVQGLSLDVKSGEFIVLLGPSGAGKTTTLRLIAGLETPSTGCVLIAGQDVTQQAPALRDVTFVFQQYSLYPHLSVFDNLAFPLRSPMRPTPPAEILRKVTEVAQMLRIEDKLQSPATRLSGGQMQRVAIGRALVRNPAVTLMDEPLSSLDAKLRNDLRLELKRIQQDLGSTMVVVTHDQTEALTMATRVGVLQQGVLVQLGTPRQIYEDPVSSYVAQRLGSPRINLVPVPALMAALWAAAGSSQASPVTPPPQAVDAGIRCENLALVRSPTPADAVADVQRVERLSDQHLVHVQLRGSGHSLVSATPVASGLAPGDAVALQVAQALWFGALGQRLGSV
jgi:multiple sugar transport system ATP-binding protein